MHALANRLLTRRFGVHPARLTLSVFLCLPYIFLCSSDCFPQQSLPTDSQVKAAYLYNFGRFVRWHESPAEGATFAICVLGKSPFGTALSSIVAGETIDGKPIVAKNITSPQEAASCGILFVSTSEEARFKQIMLAVRHSPALTVSDIPGFANRGGMIEFVNHGGKIRFEVNVEPMKDAGLTVSSELLKVAIKVTGVAPGEGVSK
jgi:hypothetical protein